jgi:hypothetical protein
MSGARATAAAEARELRRARDALLSEMADAADGVQVLATDATEGARQRWIEAAARYAARRQRAVDRLAAIDAALGGEAPQPICRDALQRILDADRVLLAESARLMARIQEEMAERRQAARAARTYRAAGDPPPNLRIAW